MFLDTSVSIIRHLAASLPNSNFDGHSGIGKGVNRT